MTIGSEILEELHDPTSVSALWERYKARQHPAVKCRRITFDWFSLALAALYAMNLVNMSENGYIGRVHVS